MALINSIATAIGFKENLQIATCSLIPFSDADPDALDEDRERAFQYYPETITDSKASEWVSKKIPGGSHPLYQWIAGMDRVFSFTAVFSDEKSDTEDSGINILGAISKLVGTDSENTDLHTAPGGISSALAWLRGFLYPTYVSANGGSIGRAQAPPKMLLVMPGSGIRSGVSGFSVSDSVPVIMTQCDITYETFFRNGKPRYTTVQLSMNEIVQVGDTWGFVDRNSIWCDGNIYDKYTKRASARSTKKECGLGNPNQTGLSTQLLSAIRTGNIV